MCKQKQNLEFTVELKKAHRTDFFCLFKSQYTGCDESAREPSTEKKYIKKPNTMSKRATNSTPFFF